MEFVHHVDQIELAWSAGFYDGEGCLSKRTNGSSSTKYPFIAISQAHPEVLNRFRDTFGMGSVTGPFSRTNPDHSDMFYYHLGARNEVDWVISLLYPLLGSVKKNQIDVVLSNCEQARPYVKRSSKEEIEKIITMYKNGESYIDIATKLNKKYDNVVKLISKHRINDKL